MKLKSDFVTNSSSISFCVFGILTDLNEFECDKLKSHIRSYFKKKNLDKGIDWHNFEQDENTHEYTNEYLQSVCENLIFSNGYFDGDDGLIIGISPDSIGGDETINQAKENVVRILRKMGINCDFNDIKFICQERSMHS